MFRAGTQPLHDSSGQFLDPNTGLVLTAEDARARGLFLPLSNSDPLLAAHYGLSGDGALTKYYGGYVDANGLNHAAIGTDVRFNWYGETQFRLGSTGLSLNYDTNLGLSTTDRSTSILGYLTHFKTAESGIAGAWADSVAGNHSVHRRAAASCGCATSCGVHGHDHASAWSNVLPIGDLKSFWGALGCSCWAV